MIHVLFATEQLPRAGIEKVKKPPLSADGEEENRMTQPKPNPKHEKAQPAPSVSDSGMPLTEEVEDAMIDQDIPVEPGIPPEEGRGDRHGDGHERR